MVKLFTIDQSWHDLQGTVDGAVDIIRPLQLDKIVNHIDNDVKKKTNIITKDDLEYKICNVYFNITESNDKYIIHMQLKAFVNKNEVIDIAENAKEVTKDVNLNDIFIEMYVNAKIMD